MSSAIAERPALITPPPLGPLESGMRMTSAAFESLYLLHQEIRKAELVEGVVYVASPVRLDSHGEPTFHLGGWLSTYRAMHPGVQGAENATVRLDESNNVQPDLLLRYRSGASVRSTDDYIEGAPELVVEVAASSASIDLGDKMRAYLRNGVQEYIVWQIHENRLDWFSLEGGRYMLLLPDRRGVIHSKVFPGLRLAVRKLLAGDIAGVLAEQNRKIRQPK